MDKQNLRFFLLLALLAVGMFLYNTWQIEHAPVKPKVVDSAPTVVSDVGLELPQEPVSKKGISFVANDASSDASSSASLEQQVLVQTDVMTLVIDRNGGDVVRLELTEYPEDMKDEEKGFVLLDNSANRYYVAQSGLLSADGPDSVKIGRSQFSSKKSKYKMSPDGSEPLVVDLFYKTSTGVDIVKRFSFHRGSYTVDVEYLINNKGSENYEGRFFGRLRRTRPLEQEASFLGPMRTYTGAAVNTPDKAYKKISFDDMEKKPFNQDVPGGWAAVIEHYFTSAWVPNSQAENLYQSQVFSDKSFGIGFVGQKVSVGPGQKGSASAKLYMGPRITESLKGLASGLELTVDYGVLWWICQPIFVLLKWLYSLVGNWGVAIILVTVTIKLAFYKLSAASYRSMGNMKKLQPRIEELKQRFADDKQQFSQAVMGLYKSEKVNPLGGCLPMLIQIPVFIALYYVLLESVELRQAPFALWISDLSVKDPFYVLPLLMGLSMLLQQKMNPAPPDPVQAKVMMAMPFVFTIVFLNFPAGLVLYWVVNNSLSIAQQWAITRRIEAGEKTGTKNNKK